MAIAWMLLWGLLAAIAALINPPADQVCIGISALPAGADAPVGVQEWCEPTT